MMLGYLHLAACAVLGLALLALWVAWRNRDFEDDLDREYRELVASMRRQGHAPR
jgi:hypothetical protein